MTRKRFVKLLMGKFGFSRDFANEIARATRRHGHAYDDKFFWQWLIYEMPLIRLRKEWLNEPRIRTHDKREGASRKRH